MQNLQFATRRCVCASFPVITTPLGVCCTRSSQGEEDHTTGGHPGGGGGGGGGGGPGASAMAEADATINDIFGYWGKQYDKLAKQAASAVGADPATFTFGERPKAQRTAHKGTGLEHANALITNDGLVMTQDLPATTVRYWCWLLGLRALHYAGALPRRPPPCLRHCGRGKARVCPTRPRPAPADARVLLLRGCRNETRMQSWNDGEGIMTSSR